MTTHVANLFSTAAPQKLHFPASHATRQAEKSLERSDVLIYPKLDRRTPPPSGYASVDKALAATLMVPQYRRTYIQGCACATGIAGGGCCPGNAMGAATGASNVSGMAAMVPADLALGAMSVYGMYTGYDVARNAHSALQHLGRVQSANTQALGRSELWRAQANKVGLNAETALLQGTQAGSDTSALPETRAAAKAAVDTLQAEARDLEASIAEQKFNIAVPGIMQLAAATTATVATIGHLAHGCLGAVGGAAVGSCASGLFALYGGVLAMKNLREYVAARKLTGIPDDALVSGVPGIDAPFREAVNRHLEATRQNKLWTGIAWTAVCAAGVLGTLVASGALAFSGSLPVVLAIGLAAGAWAMWQNSRTRYVPHMPISPHVERADINTSKDRAITWHHLSRQDDAIKQAVAQMTAVQKRYDLLKHHLQRLFRPQCGPKAFTVLAKSVQTGRGKLAAHTPAQLQSHYERVQVEAATTWCIEERKLLEARFKGRSEALWSRFYELKALTSPCCIPMTKTADAALQLGTPTEPVYTQAARDLQAEALDLEQAARRLLAIDTLNKTLTKLKGDIGALRTTSADTWTDAQRDWVFSRMQLLQLSGALSDAVSKKFMDAHTEFFSHLSVPDALPVGNVFLHPDQAEAFARAIATDLDGQFTHAFFNPRRIEGEMDFIIERELKQRNLASAQDAPGGAPKCDSGSCCR